VKLFEIAIKPETMFGSLLKGDTIFGHFCWQVKHDPSLVNRGIEHWISRYENAPFAVFSSACPKFSADKPVYALKKPDIPLEYSLGRQNGKDRKVRYDSFKEEKRKKWVLVGEDLKLDMKFAEFATDKDLAMLARRELTHKTGARLQATALQEFVSSFDQPHNTINRLTGTTGEGMFAPFSEAAYCFYPETELAIFVGIEEEATDMDRVCKGLQRIGKYGYGKNASIGLGRFSISSCEEIRISPSNVSPNACYALSPVVPERGGYSELYFSPFIRFGKHGDALARSANPFKNPIIMADEGAILFPKDTKVFNRQYLGRAVLNTSITLPASVAQGYSLFLPLSLEIAK